MEAGRLTQIVYPSLGVTFISIQENVNSTTGEGMEMLPFYNIFNEWYAAQTSKKIRAVWQSKADNGKRISSTVPYGYVRDAEDKEKWLIDEPAAIVVRKIFDLCANGFGPLQIAKRLRAEEVLIPTAYYAQRDGKLYERDPFNWDQKTVAGILERVEYLGHTVNFKTTSKNYKS